MNNSESREERKKLFKSLSSAKRKMFKKKKAGRIWDNNSGEKSTLASRTQQRIDGPIPTQQDEEETVTVNWWLTSFVPTATEIE